MLTRRQLLSRTASATAVVAAVESCGDSRPLATATPVLAEAVDALPAFTFTDAQRRALTAAVARLIPAAGAGDWSAADAGAVDYIERLLNAFSDAAANPKLYGGGPTRPHFAEFHRLSRAKRLGWQREVLRLRDLYSSGLDLLNRQDPGANDFASLSSVQQDLVLEGLDLQAALFFETLFNHTMEACYGHPVYGGNRDYVGWDSVCYEGDVHGVRFPGGEDSSADAEPWRKFGGYAPEEMIAPGACPSGKRK
jgi:gluconate 2-dehydrogenase gamma chain